MDSYSERVKNANRIVNKHPYIQIRKAIDGSTKEGQLAIIETFKRLGIRISENNYYRAGTTEAHWGKFGQWASVLEYYCYLQDNNFEYGVLIEDDIFVPDRFKEIVEKTIFNIKNNNYPPIYRLGGGDMCNIISVKHIDSIIKKIKETTIDNPTDLYWNKYGFATGYNNVIGTIPDINSNSSILNTNMFNIKEVNELISK